MATRYFGKVSAGLPKKHFVVSAGISITSYPEVLELCVRWAAERRSAAPERAHCICVTSAHGIVLAKRDPEIQRFLNEADVVTPDGMPIVWALRSFGYGDQQRVYGPTLMLQICEQAAAQGQRIYLYGALESTLADLQERLKRRFPDLQIAGAYSPPFHELNAEEERDIQARIRTSNADIVFVGIGTPKQERWMFEHRDAFPGVTLIGVGAAFDFHAGRACQAPEWMQRNGLEWLFRLAAEPARLWRRYLITTPQFLPLWAKQKLKRLP